MKENSCPRCGLDPWSHCPCDRVRAIHRIVSELRVSVADRLSLPLDHEAVAAEVQRCLNVGDPNGVTQ